MKASDVVDMVSYAGDSPVFEDPSAVGLEYEDVTFTTADGVLLSGWFIPGGDNIVVQTHFGGLSSRSGYTPNGKGDNPPWPSSIHYLRHIRALVDAGYSVLAYDLRNHGLSAADPAGKLTSGVRESLDVLAAVRYAVSRPGMENAPVGLLSLCMGANATTYAYGAAEGLSTVPNVRALIVVQPMVTIDQLHGMGIDDDELIDAASELNQAQGGIDLRTSFLPAVSEINVPTMLVQNTNDPLLRRASIEQYFISLVVPKEMLWVDLAPARLAAYGYFADKPDDMVRFFDTHVDPQTSASSSDEVE
ncbi:alpha/beta hydrolase [Rhodococcoides yunnanense]|uniref:AB hydrolase-1 domain-containing protein n=1 Tax=Rhodococcoides yunnanense TaxID=278209 RepID=A0ABU4BKP5_9NOCA|nr:alpha/beta fold hydrolase [Rhodococcus yunnanensis]MDV6264654.1 hypothetical protein [Rhodococcus yunnanensis]